MDATIQTLYESPFCTVHNFLCQCRECSISAKEYQETFSIAYIRKGNFRFRIYRNELDAYSGLFLVTKPGYEHQVAHLHDIPDQCTIFSFPVESSAALMEQAVDFAWFFHNRDIQSILVQATPEMEWLHQLIFLSLQQPRISSLRTEQLMTDLFRLLLSAERNTNQLPLLNDKQKRYYLPVIETVKDFFHQHYTDDINLSQLAAMSNMSPFHFSRLFKQVTSVAPYGYLLQLRLHHAHLQLSNTSLPVTDIAFSTGFNSLEHFSAAFKKAFGKSPAAFKNSKIP
ncbi:AraC family transcriptional regulator [Chitinophaga sp. Cy-1792]|uniref:AraC family transcriptional regulator n=1 Tax=Chitinophaga sp. Cy-1792 TaxID=2608339 RepID=UPI00142061A1|nr:AraC family transcriptional regulator [Chitinophaga sp. Cy-1792]NIG56726.1 helix-turn-helix transcriptional regulator [Chitinophaga sp. Cy-1792]